MARQTFTYTHGDAGTEPSSSLDFAANERPNPQHFDWYWNKVITAISGHGEEFDRLDSNDDGIVDQADEADTVDGKHASDLGSGASDGGTEVLATSTDFNFGTGLSVTDDTDGTVTIDGHTKYTDTEAVTAVNAETSLTVDISGDADTLDGSHASAFYTGSVSSTSTASGYEITINGDTYQFNN